MREWCDQHDISEADLVDFIETEETSINSKNINERKKINKEINFVKETLNKLREDEARIRVEENRDAKKSKIRKKYKRRKKSRFKKKRTKKTKKIRK